MTIAQIEAKINLLTTGGKSTAVTVKSILNAIKDESCKMFEIKTISVDLSIHPSYMTDNFLSTGLGQNGMAGFAICNGQNGTVDMGGKAMIGFNADYALNSTGGATSHNISLTDLPHYDPSSSGFTIGGNTAVSTNTIVTAPVTTPISLMQPYRVVLMIQRIA